MTFCLGINLKDGLICFADRLITSGKACIRTKKVYVIEKDKHSLVIMTSGLRSVRDKAITYFEEVIQQEDQNFDKLYKAINAFGQQIRRVAKEDKKDLEASGLRFDIHCLIGGQLENDENHKLYMLYPEGNWVEITEDSPYQIVGESSYGKPVLDRTLKYDDTLEHALKVGFLSFDSTRISATDVDFPIDIIVYEKGSYKMLQYFYDRNDFIELTSWWQNRLRDSVNLLPAKEFKKIFTDIHKKH